MSGDDPKLVAWLLARFGPDGEAAGTLDEDLLVGYAEDRLASEERMLVEARLAEDPEARRVLRLVPTPASHPAAQRRRSLVPLAVAAVVLVALGLVWLLGGSEDELPADPRARLLVLADRLAAAHPDTFRGLRARIEDETAVDVPAVERGGVRVLAPRGEIGDPWPTLRWEAVAGATGYAVAISPLGRAPVFRATSTETELAILPPGFAKERPAGGGVYVFEVRAQTPFGEAGGSVTFRLASEARRRAYAAGMAAIEGEAPIADQHALLAYYALLHERLDGARASLALLETQRPGDKRAARLRRLLGVLAAASPR